MEEILVDFDTALLAEEKGFNEFCIEAFRKDDKEETLTIDKRGDLVYRPSQDFLATWLEEKHGLYITIDYDFTFSSKTNVSFWVWVVTPNKEDNKMDTLYKCSYSFSTKKEAREAGLYQSLKLI